MTSITIDDLPTSSLEGKIALITGGARGIGKATAEYFHSRGAHVVIGDVDETVGVAAAKEIGENCTSQVCDVTSWSALHGWFETAFEKRKRIDYVVVNAGVPEIEDIFADVVDAATGKLQEPAYTVLNIDLKGVLATVKLAKHFSDKAGGTPTSIVMTASTAGVVGDAYVPVYTVCKHGIIGLMRALTNDGPFAAQGIRVNCVSPYMTDTGFVTPEMRPALEALQIPINKVSTVAKAIVNLAADPHARGQNIYVAADAYTELEGPIRALRPQWLGETPAMLLERKLDASVMKAGLDARNPALEGRGRLG